MLFRSEDDLHESRAVAQVDEHDAAVVAAAVDPAGEGDALAVVLGPEVAA